MVRNLSLTRLIAILALAVFALTWNFPRPRPAQGADRSAVAHVLRGDAIAGSVVPGFSLEIEPGSTAPQGNPYTAVCADIDSYLPGLWGSYIGGDGFKGRLRSGPLPVASLYWYLPIIGYPSRHGNRLYVEIKSPDGSSIQRYSYFASNPGETLGLWRLDVGRWRGGTARVFLEDGTAGRGGWLGVGAPIASDQPGATIQTLLDGPTNYPQYWLTGLALFALVLIPGLALRHWLPPGAWTESVLLPLPGLLLLAAYGLMLWLLQAGTNGLARHLYLLGEGAMAASCWWPRKSRDPLNKSDWIWGPYAALAILAAGYGAARRPVTQEQNRLTSFQSRMVASPPDHLIPYTTAAYFHAGYNGKEHSDAYFGEASVASRGPLVPWMINGAFNLFRLRPASPPDSTAEVWPAAADGFYVARWVAFLTNACAIMGVGALALALGIGRRMGFGLLWAAAAPVVFINVSFEWPKLFAGYFVLLAAADLIRERSLWRCALWTALGYLSHPVGGLFAVPLFCWAGSSRGWAKAGRYAVFTGVLLAPWLLFKYSLHAHDQLLLYPLGDGQAYQRARSLSTWLETRWWNFWYTFVPGTWMASSLMKSWLWGPLSPPARWSIQYSKTLPGNLGYMGCALAYFALGRLGWKKYRSEMRPELLRFLGWFVLPSVLVMLIYWGYSADGLGRNCLEPLSLALIAWTAAARPISLRASCLMLGFVAIETMTAIVFGFL